MSAKRLLSVLITAAQLLWLLPAFAADSAQDISDMRNKPAIRGGLVFKNNCILCHGIKGDGKGRAAPLFNPPPANLTKSDKNDEYKKAIITLGGQAMGRSEVMPTWGGQLTEQQIDDVVAYLKTILIP